MNLLTQLVRCFSSNQILTEQLNIMESNPRQEAEGRAICQVLAMVLERLVDASSNFAQDDTQVTKFHALRAPAIGICQYLERCVYNTRS